MNTRYHAVMFPCMEDGSGNCVWNGQDYDHIDDVSLHGATNLDYSTARFVTRISVNQLTVGGAIDASTFVAGAALDMNLASKTCHKHEASDADIVFNVVLSGLEELFTISTSYVEYYHEDGTGVHRVVFENKADSCTGTTRADSIPAGPCYDVQSTPIQVGATEHSVAVSVRLPLDQCRTDFGTVAEACVPLIQGWLTDSASTPRTARSSSATRWASATAVTTWASCSGSSWTAAPTPASATRCCARTPWRRSSSARPAPPRAAP